MYDRSSGNRAVINFGILIVGNFDTGMMRKISTIGDTVNLASRIETANKNFGTQLLISQSEYEQIQGLVKTKELHSAPLHLPVVAARAVVDNLFSGGR